MLAALALAWAFRWERVASNQHGAIMVNRWTGDVAWVGAQGWRHARPPPPTADQFLDK